MVKPASAHSSGLPASALRVRFPLSVKILVWFACNLLFLALVAAIAIRIQFRFGLDSLLAGRAGEKLQATAELVTLQCRDLPRSEWAQVLSRFAIGNELQLALVRGDGTTLAGTVPEIPKEVLEHLRQPGPGAPPPRPENGPPGPRPGGRPEHLDGPPFGPGPPDRDGRRPPPDPHRPGPGFNGAPEFAPDPLRPHPGGGPEPFPPAGPQPDQNRYPKFIVQAGAPAHYWMGTRVPIAAPDGRPGAPTILLASANSLSSGKFLFDFTPWLAVGAGVLICSLLFWIPLVRGITHSLHQMTAAATQMALGRFETVVDTRRSDELGRLGSSLNHMAGQLQQLISGQKRFLGDIAHELCSPLARMELALAVLEQRGDEKQRAYVEDVREEVRHMSGLLNELLSFTKAELRAEVELRPVPLREIVTRAASRESAQQDAVINEVDPTLLVLADPELLGRAISNLVRNALRYAGQAGPITIFARNSSDSVELLIADCGPGVPSQNLARLFDPFFRPEAARTRETGGVGLGLAIVKSCVDACGGTVSMANRQPTGLEVTITLQRA